MIAIVSGTHRNDSYTLRLSRYYQQLLEAESLPSTLFSLKDLPTAFYIENNIFGSNHGNVENLLKSFVGDPYCLVWVCPEYNGSYPGMVKLLIDSTPPEWFQGKLSVLVGLGTGRSGNVKGMDHLTSVLHYLGSDVLPRKVPASSIHKLMDKDGGFVDPALHQALHTQIIDLKKRLKPDCP